MTPHMLLLTSAEEIGGPLLIPVSNIAYMAPLNEVTRVFLKDQNIYIDVTESWSSIIAVLGGLVLKPHQSVSVPR